ncbi:MAG: superinfection immunity protein [Clostridiales bacterium]|jgi:hypothetical protein|nr:superinfection immunity protein [Clostridiales bacterium]
MDKIWFAITGLFANLDGLGITGEIIKVGGIIVGLALYLLPTFIALKTGGPNKKLAIIIDVLLGWTGLGWIAAFVFAVLKKPLGK